jgi:hypothetical protein
MMLAGIRFLRFSGGEEGAGVAAVLLMGELSGVPRAAP